MLHQSLCLTLEALSLLAWRTCAIPQCTGKTCSKASGNHFHSLSFSPQLKNGDNNIDLIRKLIHDFSQIACNACVEIAMEM